MSATTTKSIHKILAGMWDDGTRPKDTYAKYVAEGPSVYVETIIAGLQSDIARVQSGCAIIASLVAEAHPKLLFRYDDLFLTNLAAKQPVLPWEAVCAPGNLAKADETGKVRSAIDSVSAFLNGKSIVLQGHSARALTKIAIAFPEEAKKVQRLLIASKNRIPRSRTEFIIEARESLGGNRELASVSIDFVEPYVHSDISSVATKAYRVLKKLATRQAPSESVNPTLRTRLSQTSRDGLGS